jgi:hypothetical protein
MKIKFWCDNGANIHSERKDIFTPEDLGYTEEDWAEMTEDEKQEVVKDWALERFDYGFEEIEE